LFKLALIKFINCFLDKQINRNMKRKNIIIVVLLVLASALAMQGCKKDESPTPVLYKAAVPANPTPAVDAIVPLAGTTYTLTWEGEASSTWDVYVGINGSPTLAQAGVTGNSYTFTTSVGGLVEWYVETIDANGKLSSNIIGPSRSPWSFFINSAPDAPTLLDPMNDSIGFPVSSSLTWEGADPEGDPLTFDVYFGTTATPGIVASDLADPTYTPAMEASTKYYWKVVAKDNHGASTSSVIHSFTTGLEPIMTYTGDYTADEPAENYTYDISFAKASATSIQTDNYWNSGWTAIFDINWDNLSYTMAYTEFSSGYAASESGSLLDATSGKMQGTYTIWHNGAIIEQGVHTYTKK
jgi:hypothetical protein